MCLAIPGQLLHWTETSALRARGMVQFGGIARECFMACVPEAEPGDYVLVHAGVAIGRIDAAHASLLLAELASLPAEDSFAGDSGEDSDEDSGSGAVAGGEQ